MAASERLTEEQLTDRYRALVRDDTTGTLATRLWHGVNRFGYRIDDFELSSRTDLSPMIPLLAAQAYLRTEEVSHGDVLRLRHGLDLDRPGEELIFEEIGELLSISRWTVSRRYHSAIDTLRERTAIENSRRHARTHMYDWASM